MTYTVLNEELEGYLQLIKVDAETGKPVKIADTAFQIYKIEADGTETLLEMPDPDSETPPPKPLLSIPMRTAISKPPKNCRSAVTVWSRSKARKGSSTMSNTMSCLS